MDLIRNLVGFIIILSLLPICLLSFRFTADIPFTYSEISDELSIAQLREMLLIDYDLEFAEYSLSFRYKNRDCTLSQVGDKLIMQPGTMIFLSGLDELHFERRNGVIYVCYRKENEEYERVIAGAKGFYLDDFSDNNVRDDGTDRSEG